MGPDAAARGELSSVLAQLLNVPSVTVADDALTREPLLVIEKVRPRDARGIALTGRDFDRPEQFRLVKEGDVCVLVQLRTGVRRELRQLQCTPAAAHR